ncbi:MAG: hypothetical protein AAF570_00730 [Bacteroidota bacterium]
MLYSLLILSGLFLLAGIVMRAGSGSIWDDSYFFSRYADHWLGTGDVSWNVGEAPVYGTTSVMYLVYMAGLRWLMDGEPALTLWVGSVLTGLLALGVLGWMVRKYTDAFGKYSLYALGIGLATVACNIPQLVVHFSSGMDTMAAVAYLGVYLSLVKHFEAKLSPGKALVIGVVGGMAWFVRPDLLLFTIGIPVALAVFGKRRITRLQGAYTLIFTAFVMLTQALIAAQSFEMFLPLSFYVKSMNPYGPELAAAYQWEGLANTGIFLAANILPLLLIGVAMFRNFKHWNKATSVTDKAMLLCLLGFVAYHTVFVTPIMGYGQRFLYPAWPALLLLGVRSGVYLLYEQPHAAPAWFGLQSSRRALMPVLALGAYLLVTTFLFRPANLSKSLGDFSIRTHYELQGRHNWPFLERFSILPDDLDIASTELGILSAMNPRKKIVDMTGLHDPIYAKSGFDPVRFATVQQPDLVYLPHPDYVQMHTQLLQSEAFTKAYAIYPSVSLQSWQGIALRKDSPYFQQMKYIVDDEIARLPD